MTRKEAIKKQLSNIVAELAGPDVYENGISFSDANKMVEEAFNTGVKLSAHQFGGSKEREKIIKLLLK